MVLFKGTYSAFNLYYFSEPSLLPPQMNYLAAVKFLMCSPMEIYYSHHNVMGYGEAHTNVLWSTTITSLTNLVSVVKL